MVTSKIPAEVSTLRLLEELPGIADVVWATVTRLARAAVPTSVLFTAVEERAGTSLLASATAIGLAQHQRLPVCLVESNVQRPAVARYFGLDGAGLSDVLDGRAELEDCLQEPRDCPGLLVLPSGTARAPVPGEFATDRLTTLLARLEQRCHYLVIDAAPVRNHVESRQLLRHADAVLLVLRARVTRRSDAERTHDILLESGTPILGSIFNAYRTEGFFGNNRQANRAFENDLRAVRRRPSLAPAALRAQSAKTGTNGSPGEHEDHAPGTNGATLPGNGGFILDVPVPADVGSEAGHRRQIDILERRIVKLTRLLEQTEADLRCLAEIKDVDLGIASLYRGVQGISSQEKAQALKRSLMQKIFEANLKLKTATARHP